jgi:hypothetical protein
MHLTEGWLIFLVAFIILGGIAWSFGAFERWIARRGQPPEAAQPVEEYEEEEFAEEYPAEPYDGEDGEADEGEAFGAELAEADVVQLDADDQRSAPVAEHRDAPGVVASEPPAEFPGFKPPSEAPAHA